jgi:hypothetical protein
MPLPRDMFFVIVYGRAKKDRMGPNLIDGEFHSFHTKKEMNETLGVMGAKPHDHDILKGQAFFKLPDNRAGVIIKGQRWTVTKGEKSVN